MGSKYLYSLRQHFVLRVPNEGEHSAHYLRHSVRIALLLCFILMFPFGKPQANSIFSHYEGWKGQSFANKALTI